MADDFTTLNSGSGGDSMDEEGVTYGQAPTTRKRARVIVGGSTAAALAGVINSDPTDSDYGLVVRSIDREPKTFTVVTDRIAPAQNKYMLTLFNSSATRKVVLQRVWMYNWNITGITGVLNELEFRRITARTAGTSLTPIAHDTNDSISAGITADHTSTSVTDSTLIKRHFSSAEEVKIGALTLENSTGFWCDAGLVYYRQLGTRGITLRQNQGITLKHITSSTAGTLSCVIEFTDEVA